MGNPDERSPRAGETSADAGVERQRDRGELARAHRHVDGRGQSAKAAGALAPDHVRPWGQSNGEPPIPCRPHPSDLLPRSVRHDDRCGDRAVWARAV